MPAGHLFANTLFSVIEKPDGSEIVATDYLSTDSSTGNLNSLSMNTGKWTSRLLPHPSTPDENRVYAIAAASIDGVRMYATRACHTDSDNYGILRSVDSGASWGRTGDGCYTSIATDGWGVVAIAQGRAGLSITTSAGETWHSPTVPPSDESIVQTQDFDGHCQGAVAISSDGSNQVITTGLKLEGMYFSNFGNASEMFPSWSPNYIGHIHTSSDGGSTWAITSAPAAHWMSVASSSDGLKLAAVVWSGGIYVSTDRGGSWTLTSATTQQWSSIASSSDGSRLCATVYDGGLYISIDGGSSWGHMASAPSNTWARIASSADGTELVALAVARPSLGEGGLWISSDAGASWNQISSNYPSPPLPPPNPPLRPPLPNPPPSPPPTPGKHTIESVVFLM